MSDQIREACERLRPLTDPSRYGAYDDLNAVARAYLAEHDPTPITDEWLRAVGFEPRGDKHPEAGAIMVLGCLMLAASGTFVHLRFRFEKESDYRYVSIQNKQTRGAVRRLASALGITLKEQP